jgi:N-methylhydantoinase A
VGENALGIDIGGTFTDVILVDGDGRVHTDKRLNTTDDVVRGCNDGVAAVLGVAGASGFAVQRVVHATTQATNAVLERKRPPVAFVTTTGFRDLLEICGARTSLYELDWEPWRPPTIPELTFEVTERLGAKGQVEVPLDTAAVGQLAEILNRAGVAGVAVCLINSYAHPDHELAVGQILEEALPDSYVALSSDVWPQLGENHRAAATVLTAYIGPVMAGYLDRLVEGLQAQGIQASVQVMQSNGGCMSSSLTARRPLPSIESGPAAGALAAGFVGSRLGLDRVIAFDMGGTTAKASFIEDGRPRIRSEFYVGGRTSGAGDGIRLRMPVVDLAEVGAGGGSIAWIDGGGMLRVGPQSAGASPGPACYGFGGSAPTVTDANLLLGYLSPTYFLGGAMPLHVDLAEASMHSIRGERIETSTDCAALVHDIANLNMEDALRLVTLARGVDPRECALMAFGGAGPTHAARLAEPFGVAEVVVPRIPGLFSTFGLLTSDVVHEEVRSVFLDFEGVTHDVLQKVFEELEARSAAEVVEAGIAPESLHVERTVDIRRRSQSHDLRVPVPAGLFTRDTLPTIRARYHQEYLRSFGITRETPLVIQACRVRTIGTVDKPALVPGPTLDQGSRQKNERPVYFRETSAFVTTPVYERGVLPVGASGSGPAIIEEKESTTVVPPTWTWLIDSVGNIRLSRIAGVGEG